MKKVSLLLAFALVLSLFGSALADEKPATWIADRVVQVQAYVDDIGDSLPDDQLMTPVMEELAKRTGIKLEFLYTQGEKDRYVMAAQMATGDLPDLVCGYLNNSTRPEFPILLKAAKEGLFTDLAPFIKDSKVYSKYLDKDYLPADSYNNIVWRKDFDGKAYFMHLSIPAEDTSTIWNPKKEYVGGMYIQKAIADDLHINVKEINSSEKLYKLLQDIKAKEYKDANGQPVTPLGPKYWGGSVDSLEFVLNDLHWGVSGDYNLTDDGKVIHEAQTDWVFKKINWIRNALKEGLMHKEFFTMDETRVHELCENKSVAIISDIHNYKELIYASEDWIPLGPLTDYKGESKRPTSGKGGYGFFAIPKTTKNPEEIVKLLDYLSSYEGQMLALYGVEGVSYDMVDGKPILKEEVLKALKERDKAALRNKYGASFNGDGVYGLEFLLTDTQNEKYFGEATPGAASSDTFERPVRLATEYAREYRLVPGLRANAFLIEFEDINNAMNLLDYKEMIVQASFADSDEQVKQIVEKFRDQLKDAGIEKFCEHVENMHKDNPSLVRFY